MPSPSLPVAGLVDIPPPTGNFPPGQIVCSRGAVSGLVTWKVLLASVRLVSVRARPGVAAPLWPWRRTVPCFESST
jgi:hypothetical protein